MIRAAGQMGWSEEQFDLTTPAYFVAAYGGFIEQRGDWERARYQAFYSLMPHTKKGRLKKMADLGRFPWEKAPAPPAAADSNGEKPAFSPGFAEKAKRMHAARGGKAELTE